jgi:hypothetical protein
MSAIAIAFIWERMIKLAETANDEAVSGQRVADLASAQRIVDAAGSLHTLAQAVVILARGEDDA